MGNIPFAITSDIIRKLLDSSTPAGQSVLIVQKQAALRLVGKDHTDRLENFISLKYKPWFDIEIIQEFNSNDFYPIPHVGIVLLKITLKNKPYIHSKDKELYLDFIAYVFASWKKNIALALKGVFTSKQLYLMNKLYGINFSLSITQISFEEWLQLFDVFIKHTDESKKKLV